MNKLGVDDLAAYVLNGSAGSKPLRIDHALLKAYTMKLVAHITSMYDTSGLDDGAGLEEECVLASLSAIASAGPA